MSENKSLSDELTGNGGVQTDHGGMDVGDLVVLLFDAVLLVYTAWRSYDFLTTTVPDGFQFLALVGLWGLDIGAIGWSIVWIFGSTTKYQDWTAITFFVVDLAGVVLTSLTDSLMYSKEETAVTSTLSGIAMVVIPLTIVANVIAGFIYHMVSPATKARRANRKADAEHARKMGDLTQMERDLSYAEQYLLARQDQLEKSQLLANIKTQQDTLEKSVRAQLNDRIGVQAAASAASGTGEETLAELKKRVDALKSSVPEPASSPTPQQSAPAPAPQTPAQSSRPDPIYHPVQPRAATEPEPVGIFRYHRPEPAYYPWVGASERAVGDVIQDGECSLPADGHDEDAPLNGATQKLIGQVQGDKGLSCVNGHGKTLTNLPATICVGCGFYQPKDQPKAEAVKGNGHLPS